MYNTGFRRPLTFRITTVTFHITTVTFRITTVILFSYIVVHLLG